MVVCGRGRAWGWGRALLWGWGWRRARVAVCGVGGLVCGAVRGEFPGPPHGRSACLVRRFLFAGSCSLLARGREVNYPSLRGS